MNPFEMVVLIVFIVMVGNVLRGRRSNRIGLHRGESDLPPEERA